MYTKPLQPSYHINNKGSIMNIFKMHFVIITFLLAFSHNRPMEWAFLHDPLPDSPPVSHRANYDRLLAAIAGEDVVEAGFLIDERAHLQGVSRGLPPLDFAVYRGLPSTVDYFLRSGVPIIQDANIRRTPLHLSAILGASNGEIRDALIHIAQGFEFRLSEMVMRASMIADNPAVNAQVRHLILDICSRMLQGQITPQTIEHELAQATVSILEIAPHNRESIERLLELLRQINTLTFDDIGHTLRGIAYAVGFGEIKLILESALKYANIEEIKVRLLHVIALLETTIKNEKIIVMFCQKVINSSETSFVNAQDHNGVTALYEALEGGRFSEAYLILDASTQFIRVNYREAGRLIDLGLEKYKITGDKNYSLFVHKLVQITTE